MVRFLSGVKLPSVYNVLGSTWTIEGSFWGYTFFNVRCVRFHLDNRGFILGLHFLQCTTCQVPLGQQRVHSGVTLPSVYDVLGSTWTTEGSFWGYTSFSVCVRFHLDNRGFILGLHFLQCMMCQVPLGQQRVHSGVTLPSVYNVRFHLGMGYLQLVYSCTRLHTYGLLLFELKWKCKFVYHKEKATSLPFHFTGSSKCMYTYV